MNGNFFCRLQDQRNHKQLVTCRGHEESRSNISSKRPLTNHQVTDFLDHQGNDSLTLLMGLMGADPERNSGGDNYKVSSVSNCS